MTGILPEGKIDFAGARSHATLPDTHPLSIAINDLTAKCRVEQERSDLAPALEELLREDLEAERIARLGSENTQKQYVAEFKRFREFCKHERLSWLPSHPEAVSYYLITRFSEGAPYPTLRHIRNAIRWCHELADVGHSFDHTMIRATMRWAKRGWSSRGKAPAPQPDPTNGVKEREHA